MSWEPLHSGEPFKGDHDGIRTYADKVTATGELIEEQATLLRRLADRDNWRTDTADAFREKAEELAKEISKAKDRYLETGAALSTFADQLEEHRRQARIKVDAAAPLVSAAGSTEVEPTPGADGTPGELTPEQESHNARRSEAIEDLARLQREFDGIVSAAEQDASDAESKINHAKDDDVKDGFWEKHAGWIRTVAGVIAAVAAVVMLTVATGGLIWVVALVVAIAAGVVALAMSIGRFATGNGPWYEIAFDAVGLLTLGTGGLAIRALTKGFPALRGAYAAFQGGRASATSLGRFGGLPWRAFNWASSARIPLLGSRVPFLTGLGERGVLSMAHTAALAEDAARTVASTAPAVSRLQSFLLGGAPNAEMISHVQQMRTALTGLDGVPTSLMDDVVRAGTSGQWANIATNVNSVNQLGSLVVGSVTDPLNPDNPVGVAQVVVDVIGRLQ